MDNTLEELLLYVKNNDCVYWPTVLREFRRNLLSSGFTREEASQLTLVWFSEELRSHNEMFNSEGMAQ